MIYLSFGEQFILSQEIYLKIIQMDKSPMVKWNIQAKNGLYNQNISVCYQPLNLPVFLAVTTAHS